VYRRISAAACSDAADRSLAAAAGDISRPSSNNPLIRLNPTGGDDYVLCRTALAAVLSDICHPPADHDLLLSTQPAVQLAACCS